MVRPDVLILDDLGMRKFSAQEAEDLRDVMEHRSYGKSTIIGDALIERLQPDANTIVMQGPGYRSEAAKRVDKNAAQK